MAETVLAATLGEYARQLETHLAALRARHEHLQTAWVRLREVYEGEGAQIFGEAFEAASAKLAEYSAGGAAIVRELQAKIGELRTFQAADPEL